MSTQLYSLVSGTWVAAGGRSVASGSYTRPSGAGYTPYESLTVKGTPTGTGPNGQLSATTVGMSSSSIVTFAAGTYEMYDFADPNADPVYGAYERAPVLGFAGSGIDTTYFQVHPQSSTKASSIPVQSTGSTNQLSIFRFDGAPKLSGFTMTGTDQPVFTANDSPGHATGKPHCYNGLQLYQTSNAQITDVKVKGIPGSYGANPGETFSINGYRDSGTTLTRVEIDGSNAASVRTAGSAIGLNFSTNFTTVDCYAHDVLYGAGITHYGVVGGYINHTNFRAYNNELPFNFEHNNGVTITMTGCSSKGNRSNATSAPIKPIFAVIDSDTGSCVLNIIDPQIDDGSGGLMTPTPANPLIVVRHGTYGGGANMQLASDIHLTLGGVDRTADCLRIASNESLPDN